MAIRIKVGQGEFECDTKEDLLLVAETFHLFDGESGPASTRSASKSEKTASGNGAQPAELALLTDLVDAGETGIEGKRIAQMIGAHGRGFTGAIAKWAKSVGLVAPDA